MADVDLGIFTSKFPKDIKPIPFMHHAALGLRQASH